YSVIESSGMSTAKQPDPVYRRATYCQCPRPECQISIYCIDFTKGRTRIRGVGNRCIDCHQTGALVLNLGLDSIIVEKRNGRAAGIINCPCAAASPEQLIKCVILIDCVRRLTRTRKGHY